MTLAAAEFAIMNGSGLSENAAPPEPGRLSERERELVSLVAQGQTDARIAEKLFISVSLRCAGCSLAREHRARSR